MTQIKTSHQRGEAIPANFVSDHEWFLAHQPQLFEQYGECCLFIYEQQIIGIGDNYETALSNAEQNTSQKEAIITPIFEVLLPPNPLLRAYPQPELRPAPEAN